MSVQAQTPFRRALRSFLEQRTARVGIILLFVLVTAALGADVFASYSPIDVLIDKEPGAIRLAGPCINALGCDGPQHIFGLDNNVRDVFARVLHGARLSLQVGFLTVGFAIVLGSLIGAQIAAALPGKLLGIFFAVFVAFSATQMFLNRKPKPSRTMPGPLGTFGVGGVIGVLSALVGAGGAFVSVPFMTWCNVKIHDAVGTSSALGFPIALGGTIGYIWAGHNLPLMPPGSFGYLYIPGLIVISLASVSMAPLGAKTAHSMDINPLKKVFASVLYLMAGYFIFR